jgi:uncharacterized protein YceK
MRCASSVFAAVLVIVLSGCGTIGTGSAPSSNPRSTVGVGHVHIFSEQDRAATIQVGQTLLLELHAKPGMSDWSGVRSNDTSLLKPLTIDVMVPRHVTVAAFQAISPGGVMVTAAAGPLCAPGQLCPAYVVLYSLRVKVVPS